MPSQNLLHDTSDRHVQVAILGGGLAGLILARKLSASADVMVIERGGSQPGAPDPDSAEGEASGLPYPFADTRDFRLGGSTSIWAGYCAEFDDFDFAPRDWVPLSGWPISKSDLAPFRNDAARLLNLSSVDFSPQNIVKNATKPLPIDLPGLEVTAWRFGCPQLNILEQWDLQDRGLKNVRIQTRTRVIDIQLSTDHSAVDHVLCLTDSGNTFRLHADVFVLAMGGLESTRLLLTASTQRPEGVANSSGMLGKCFWEHPHLSVDGFSIRPDHPAALLADRGLDNQDSPFAICIGVPEHEQIEREILNARAHIYRTPQMDFQEPPRLGIFLEQCPSLTSELSLSRKQDDAGIPHLALNWNINELDKHSFIQTARYVCEALEAAGAGSILSRLEPDAIMPDMILHSNHQLGTTRMSAERELGIVDADCRSHDHDNLYIISGSVFPTVGWANPSYTLALLTLRLARHLEAELKGISS